MSIDWRAILKEIMFGVIFAFLFYDSIWGVVLLAPYAPIYYKKEQKRRKRKKNEALKKEFQQVILLITKGLEIGYSLENCIKTAKIEYEDMVGNKKTPMVVELENWIKKLDMNVPIQQAFESFAEQTEIEEIKNIAQIIDIARKTGGNLPAILRKTTQVMLEKEQVQEEIITMMSAKQMEQSIMMWMPVGILCYMRMTSSDYMNALYHNMIGVVVATVGLILMAISIIWAEKIVTIHI